MHVELNPATELLMALHVMSRPGFHGPFLKWALREREALAKEVIEQLDQLYPVLTAPPPSLVPGCPVSGVPEYLRWAKDVDLHDFRADLSLLAGRWTASYDVKMARHSEWERMHELREPGFWDELIRHADTLLGMWKDVALAFGLGDFAQMWRDFEPLLQGVLTRAEADLARMHPLDWMAGLSPQVKRERPHAGLQFLIPWAGPYTVPPDGTVTVRFSVLALPHTMVQGRGSRLDIVCAPRVVREFAGPVPSPASASTLTTLLGDQSRFEIYRYAIGRPITPGALAHALRLTPSTVARHLALLQGVGLVRRERHGHFVFYQARPEILTSAVGSFGGLVRDTDPVLTKWFG